MNALNFMKNPLKQLDHLFMFSVPKLIQIYYLSFVVFSLNNICTKLFTLIFENIQFSKILLSVLNQSIFQYVNVYSQTTKVCFKVQIIKEGELLAPDVGLPVQPQHYFFFCGVWQWRSGDCNIKMSLAKIPNYIFKMGEIFKTVQTLCVLHLYNNNIARF